MSLRAGTRLGSYEITAQIGVGGMGEVYRARDTRLDRDVAIKVLPESVAADADRIARFEREAKTLAALNHPNIAQIHGLEESDGVKALVMELVEGPTLADRIAQGPIPVDEAVPIARQIAEALEAAHEQGIIHRDLKPANIKVRDDGAVKVLDFGLAKAFAGETADVSVSNSPTLSMAATQKGVILGTAAYMAPEQAKGRPVDKRADIWAFGCVLYEMLTGRQSFGASDVTESLAAVIRGDPDWALLPANVHPRVREVVARCLEKNPNRRFRDIGDVKLDIEKVLADPAGVLAEPASDPSLAGRSAVSWIVAMVLTGIVAAVATWTLKPEAPDAPRPVRFSHVLPEGERFTRVGRPVVAVSPDGSGMVYVANRQLYWRSMDTLSAMPIPGTDEDASAPFFSPDGAWIGYWSGVDRQLKKIAPSGGAPVPLAGAENPLGAPSWGADDVIVFGQSLGIMSVSANGGTPRVLIAGTGANPQVLPDGSVLFDSTGEAGGAVEVQSPDSGEPKVLFAGARARYLPTGHIVYALNDGLFAVPFDLATLETTGGHVPVIQGVRIEGFEPQYAVSDSGALAYVPGGATGAQRRLAWVDRNGVAEPIDTIPPGNYAGPRLSPDGQRVLVMADGDVWIYDMATGRPSRLTRDGMENQAGGYAEWDPTGTRIAYSSRRGGGREANVWIQSVDQSDAPRQLTDLQLGAHIDSWSLDGKLLAVHQHTPDQEANTLMIPMTGTNPEPVPFLQRDFFDGLSVFSPDGRYVAYYSGEARNASGLGDIQIRPYPGPGGQVTISVGGARGPIWAANGELFYRTLAGDRMMSVSVVTEPELLVGPPQVVFEELYPFASPTIYRADYDVTDDGERFLMLVDATTSAPQADQINVVLDWTMELLERVPVD